MEARKAHTGVCSDGCHSWHRLLPPITPNFPRRVENASQTGSVHPKAGRQNVYPSVSSPIHWGLYRVYQHSHSSNQRKMLSAVWQVKTHRRNPHTHVRNQEEGKRGESGHISVYLRSPGSNHLWSQVCFRDKTLNHCSTEAPGRNTISPLPQIAISPLPPSDSLQKFSLEALELPDLISVVNGLSGPRDGPMGFPEETRGLKGWGDICRAVMETQTLRTDLWTWLGLWGRRRGWDEWRELHGNIYYHV